MKNWFGCVPGRDCKCAEWMQEFREAKSEDVTVTLSKSLILVATLGFLSACEATPVFDTANYYPSARYYTDPLPTERAFWKIGGKTAD